MLIFGIMNSKLKDFALVYSTEKKIEKRCSGCNKLTEDCICKQSLSVAPYKAVISIEKKGRGGKTVTIASRLPAHETYLKDLCAHLKRSIGAGGTHYIKDNSGTIEIQGDRRDQMAKLIEQFKSK